MANPIIEFLENNKLRLSGAISISTAGLPDDFLKSLPLWYLDSLRNYPLAGSRMRLPAEADLSGMGVNLRWMSLKQTYEEATDAYPGLVACPEGWLPFGIDMTGSGDPYFFDSKSEKLAVARIYHDAVSPGGTLAENALSYVRLSLLEFLQEASF